MEGLMYNQLTIKHFYHMLSRNTFMTIYRVRNDTELKESEWYRNKKTRLHRTIAIYTKLVCQIYCVSVYCKNIILFNAFYYMYVRITLSLLIFFKSKSLWFDNDHSKKAAAHFIYLNKYIVWTLYHLFNTFTVNIY